MNDLAYSHLLSHLFDALNCCCYKESLFWTYSDRARRGLWDYFYRWENWDPEIDDTANSGYDRCMSVNSEYPKKCVYI